MNRFSLVCDQIAATTKKLEKERILSEYLKSLNDSDLSTATIFLTGSPFALRDQRITNTGFAAVRDALFELNPAYEEQLGSVLLRTGDFGTAIEELFSERQIEPTLSLQDVKIYFEALPHAANNAHKRELTKNLLGRSTAREAKYIIKILSGDMRIGLQESLVESSLAKAFNQNLKQLQFANMLMGDVGETALLARYGNLDTAQMRLLHPLKPMLASPEESTEKILSYMNGEGFAEDKYDGIRAQLHKQNDEIRIYSRDLDDITASFPEVVSAASKIPGSVLMDGEIVPYKNEQILGFGILQKRFGRKILTQELLESIPCKYFAFDLLFLDTDLLFNIPLKERRKRLAALQSANPDSFLISEQRVVRLPDELEEAFATATGRNNEGLVIKDPESFYVPGKRGKSWLKLKRALLSLDVVVTLAEYGHGKRAGLLSDYTFAVENQGELLTIGKAYSGVTDQEVLQLTELFQSISIENHGYYHVVPPQVVLEVTFDRINKSDRHSSGFALRFPRIKSIRWDKKPHEIDSLDTVEALYQAHFA